MPDLVHRYAVEIPPAPEPIPDEYRCPRCEGDGSYSELEDCTTFGSDCACNAPRVITDPCEACDGDGVSATLRADAR